MAQSAVVSELSPTSRRLLAALKRYCSLAWPIMKTQCGLAGLDPSALAADELALVVPQIAAALVRFTSDAKARAFQDELMTDLPSDPGPSLRAERPAPAFKLGHGEPTELAPLASRVHELLQAASPLAWTLFGAQCERAGIDSRRIRHDELKELLPQIHRALARFTSEAHADRVVAELRWLVPDGAS